MSWPEHPELPGYGYVITRADLDGIVSARAEKAGATVWQGVEALGPLPTAQSPGRALRAGPRPSAGGRGCSRQGPGPFEDYARCAPST